MNNIDAKITAWQLGPVTIMRGTATPGRDVTHPECFGRFTVVALSYGGAIRKCMRRVAGRDRAIPAHPHRRGEGHHPASPPGTRAGKTRRHRRQ